MDEKEVYASLLGSQSSWHGAMVKRSLCRLGGVFLLQAPAGWWQGKNLVSDGINSYVAISARQIPHMKEN